MIAVISAAPDVDAFMGGVVMGLSALLLVLAVWGAVAIVRRIVGA